MTQTPSGWYDDPENSSQIRWWDGTNWGATAPKNPAPPQTPPISGPSRQPSNTSYFAPPSNYLAWSIINIFICMPFGIVGLIFSLQVNSAVQMGNQNGALDASSKAKTFNLIGTIGAVVLLVLYFIIAAAAVSSLPNNNG